MIKWNVFDKMAGERYTMELGELLIEGKGKRVYAAENPDEAIVYFKDEAMAYHGLKRGRILGKGEVNNIISEQFFRKLEANGIHTHYIRRLDARQSLVYRCEILPLSVKVRNRVASSLAKRIGLPVGTKLDTTVVEYEYKRSEMEYPLINSTHIAALHIATPEEVRFMTETALKINDILSDVTAEISVELVDFKLEFGRFHGELLVADEISPDSARFWDAKTHEPMGLDRFRRDMDNVEQAYQDLLHRMMGE